MNHITHYMDHFLIALLSTCGYFQWIPMAGCISQMPQIQVLVITNFKSVHCWQWKIPLALLGYDWMSIMPH